MPRPCSLVQGRAHKWQLPGLRFLTGYLNPTVPVRPERGLSVCVHLRQQSEPKGWGTWVDGKFLPIRYWERGGVAIYNLEANPIGVRPTGFDSVHFNLPRRTLNAFTDDNELHRIGGLPCTQGIKNDVLFHLTRFALPWLGDERRVCSLMFDYFVWMFCSHIAASYGQVGPRGPPIWVGWHPSRSVA